MPHIPASSALSRFRVLDLTRVRSGPTCVRQLADFGADVIMIEPPPGADPAAAIFGSRHHFEMQNLHRNKRAMTLNLKQPKGVEVFMKLVAKSDVVVENYKPDVKFRLGIDYESLKKVNRGIVLASVSGFGQDGPYVDRGGFDQIAQGMTGVMSVTGFPANGPTRTGGAVVDITCGFLTAFGIVTALLERERSGEGQWVQTDLMNAGTASIDHHVARYLATGHVNKQLGNALAGSMPINAYKTTDGFMNIAASGNVIWARFAKAVGREEWLTWPEFKGDADRVKHTDLINKEVQGELGKKSTAEWVEILNKAGVPCGPIYSLDQVFADPQIKHLGIAATVKHPILGEIKMQNQPVKLTRTPASIVRPTPEFGEQTDEVLTEFGYSSSEIESLRAAGVV